MIFHSKAKDEGFAAEDRLPTAHRITPLPVPPYTAVETPTTMARVILIEDDALVRTLLMRRMTLAGWNVIPMKDGRGLGELLAHEAVDLLVIDLGLPYVDGLSLVEGLRARGIGTPVLVISAYELPHLHATVQSAGANDLVQKPFDQEELMARMAMLLAA